MCDCGIEQRVGAAPGIKIAAGQDDFFVDAVAQGGLRPERVQCVAGVGGKTVGEARIELLIFVQVGAANGEPIAIALILVL